MIIKPTKRLNILSNAEISQLYDIPDFNDEQRAFHFHLDDLEKHEMESLRSIESRLYFVLQLGYFKYKSMFFDINSNKAHRDMDYIFRKYFFKGKLPRKTVSQKTQLENKARILKVLGFKLFDREARETLEEQALQSIKVSASPRYIFDSLMASLDKNHIALPGL